MLPELPLKHKTGCCALVPLNAFESADLAHCLVNFSVGRQNERSSVRCYCRAAGDWFTCEQVQLQTFCAAAHGQEDAARASQLPWEQAGSSGAHGVCSRCPSPGGQGKGGEGSTLGQGEEQ